MFHCLIAGVLAFNSGLSASDDVLTPAELETIERLPKVAGGLNPGYTIERRATKSVDTTLFYMVMAPELQASHWEFIAPWPPDLPSQQVHYVRSSPKADRGSELSALRRKILVINLKAGKHTQNTAGVKIYYGAQLYARSLRVDKSKIAKADVTLSDLQRKLFLRPSPLGDYTSEEFQDWIHKNGFVRKSDEGEIDLARRVFQGLASKFRYQADSKLDRSLIAVCRSGKSDCGGLSNLFVATLRAQGIPARSLVGRWAKSAVKGEKVGGVPYFQSHVKAEFFAQGVGWIPVDLASAVLDSETPDKLIFFGRDPGDFITMHVDPRLRVVSEYFGMNDLTWLQDVTFWVRGEGALTGHVSTGTWQVK
ncbi:hypothetical protein JIN77_13240 [Verrucomicrobiaceae bacterium R5-34]|nr:hypothetical protein [Verrucomicrobiaceae bacterium R5-34]